MVRRQWQRACCELLQPARAHADAVFRHLRRRLERWQIQILPGRRLEHARRAMDEICGACQPRVCAALVRAWCNGWVTSRRMQRVGGCIFDCGGQDSLEHYAHCAIFRSFLTGRMGLPAVPPERRLERLLCLGTYSGDERAKRAIAFYALYSAHCSLSHGARAPDVAGDVLWQKANDAVASHPRSSALLV